MDNENIKVEYSDESNPGPVVASFKGRLNLSDYTFSPNSNAFSGSPRRSPRNLDQSTSDPLSTRPTISPQLKRKSSTTTTPTKTTLSPSRSPRKKSRSPSGYAPPSTYAHLPELRDVLGPNLICVFIGLNPGLETSRSGHAYAHPSNLFWKLLHSSGCTTRRCRPEEDGLLPELFQLGNTNIVARPTRNGSELSKREMDDGVAALEEKARRYRPESVCVVGKSIWESLFRVKKGRGLRKEEFRYGWQEGFSLGKEEAEGGWEGARVFVACSTSGLAAGLGREEKEKIWRVLGGWVEERRSVRSEDEIAAKGAEVVKVEEGIS